MSEGMTNKQAMEILEAARKTMYLPKSGKYISDMGYALEKGIAALEAEPCEDAISRQAVSSWLKQYGQDVLHGKYKFSLMYIWKNIMDLPPVTPKQSGWHYTDLPPSDDPYKRYLVVYSPYDRNYGRNTAPRFEIADYYKGDGLYNDKPWHLTISHSVMEKEILAWKDIGIVDEVMQGAKIVEPQESEG